MAERLAELGLPEGRTWEDVDLLPGMGRYMSGARPTRVPNVLSRLGAVLARRLTSDAAIVAGGVALALLCALFPWYVFLNQDDFGVRGRAFEGAKFSTPAPSGRLPQLVGARIPESQEELLKLDSMPTGTVDPEAGIASAPLSDQPFPGEKSPFRLVYVANGRAMIEDDSGYWVVQHGARLPDGSRVASIEQRDGDWVLVTTDRKIVSVER